jgi:glutaredoxin
MILNLIGWRKNNMKLVKLYKDNCRPCGMVDEFLKSKGAVYESKHLYEEPEFASKLGVMTVPVVAVLDDNDKVIAMSIGYNEGELEELIKLV